nr:hypothetical protein [uncultured Rhodopila sp.]
MFVAVALLTVAVAVGAGLALWHLRATDGGASGPPALVGALHGVIGAIGLGVLLLVLRGPARGVAAGVGSFGTTAAWLFGAALLTGIAVLMRRQRVPAVMIAIHSGFAITGYVLLLAWNSLGS